jgi:hypothetical protein
MTVHLLPRTKIYDTASSERVIVDSGLWRIWKEAIPAHCKKCLQGLPWGTEENHEIMRQDYLPPGRDSKAGPKKYEHSKGEFFQVC